MERIKSIRFIYDPQPPFAMPFRFNSCQERNPQNTKVLKKNSYTHILRLCRVRAVASLFLEKYRTKTVSHLSYYLSPVTRSGFFTFPPSHPPIPVGTATGAVGAYTAATSISLLSCPPEAADLSCSMADSGPDPFSFCFRGLESASAKDS